MLLEKDRQVLRSGTHSQSFHNGNVPRFGSDNPNRGMEDRVAIPVTMDTSRKQEVQNSCIKFEASNRAYLVAPLYMLVCISRNFVMLNFSQLTCG